MSETGLAMMKKHFIEHPEDYDEAVIYATVAGQLGMQAESLKAWEKITEYSLPKSKQSRCSPNVMHETTTSAGQ